MKLLCYLLACFVLLLSVQPVFGDVATCDDCCQQESQMPSHPVKKECSNGCNPFQVCHCCAFGIVAPNVIYHYPHITLVKQSPIHLPFLATLPEKPVLAFWQPPKIAASTFS